MSFLDQFSHFPASLRMTALTAVPGNPMHDAKGIRNSAVGEALLAACSED